MTIEIIKGCLLDAFDRGDVDVIGHVVNCQGKMNSGIAKSIRERYPEVYDEYINFCNRVGSSKVLLGCSQVVPISFTKTAFNIFGQEFYGYDGKRYLNYAAIAKSLFDMSLTGICCKPSTIGFPYKMGSDRAGGDFSIVYEMVEYYFKDHNVKFYRLDN